MLMNTKTWHVIAILAAVLPWLVIGVAVFLAWPAYPRDDLGQWDTIDAETAKWFRNLMQPDNPSVSCCGPADAYWADTFRVEGGKTIAIITDTRPDGPLGRPHIPPGTEVVVPDRKMKWDQGNPTGHGVIFLSGAETRSVYCYVHPGGV